MLLFLLTVHLSFKFGSILNMCVFACFPLSFLVSLTVSYILFSEQFLNPLVPSAKSMDLETVTSFRYLGSVLTDEGSKPEILSRIAQTTAALARLKLVWNDRSISLSSQIQLMRSLVTSIFLYACESWTLRAEL